MASLRPEQGLFSLGMPISHETILRQVKHRSRASKLVNLIRVVGVDDWAWRKGHVFGTILIDLDAGRVVDVLPDRSSHSVASWLGRHPFHLDINDLSASHLVLSEVEGHGGCSNSLA
jgi:transposase